MSSTYGVRDDCGYLWCFDGKRVYMPLVDDEEGSGYPCSSWDEAIELLNKYGYIDSRQKER